MANLNLTRLVISTLIGLTVAIVVGLQTASMVTTRLAPETALDLFPANAGARELVAFNAFSEQVSDPSDIQSAALSVREEALATRRGDPSSTTALALLALAIPDEAARHNAGLSASRINRRSLTLQGIALEAHLAAGDYVKVVETLDRVLRVHPTYKRDFFPVLGEALRQPETVPVFARLLNGSSVWHEQFLTSYAVHQKDLLPNLAALRTERELGGEAYDRMLIEKLARFGHFAEASALFQQLSSDERPSAEVLAGPRTIEWSGRFPPFDWRFSDDSAFRAQASRDGELLEIFVRPGKGGLIADRIITLPDGPFTLRLDQEAANARQAENVRIELSCPGATKPFFEKPLADGSNTLTISAAPGCEQARLAINARAFSGLSTLRSDISRIEIAPL